jgi:hypothetical protein
MNLGLWMCVTLLHYALFFVSDDVNEMDTVAQGYDREKSHRISNRPKSQDSKRRFMEVNDATPFFQRAADMFIEKVSRRSWRAVGWK